MKVREILFRALFAMGPGLTGYTSQSLIPVVMAGIIAVYSLVISVLIAGDLNPPPSQAYSLFKYVCCVGISSHDSGRIVATETIQADRLSVDSCT